MSLPHVEFTSLGRLVEHHGVVAAAEIDGQPVLCHFLKDTLQRLNPQTRRDHPGEMFRAQRAMLATYVAQKASRDGSFGDIVHLLPSDLPPATSGSPLTTV